MTGKLRVTGGRLLRHLFGVPKKADAGLVRPSSDRVREAVFSSLGSSLKDALVLDLFAGSGAYSFEALSRGAESVLMVEKDREVAHCIKNNIKKLNLLDECEVIVDDATKYVFGKNQDDYDLVFVDPPYTISLDLKFWQKLTMFVGPDGIVIYRCANKKSFSMPTGYRLLREKTYGGTYIVFLELDIIELDEDEVE